LYQFESCFAHLCSSASPAACGHLSESLLPGWPSSPRLRQRLHPVAQTTDPAKPYLGQRLPHFTQWPCPLNSASLFSFNPTEANVIIHLTQNDLETVSPTGPPASHQLKLVIRPHNIQWLPPAEYLAPPLGDGDFASDLLITLRVFYSGNMPPIRTRRVAIATQMTQRTLACKLTSQSFAMCQMYNVSRLKLI